jgi:hypothetical protein
MVQVLGHLLLCGISLQVCVQLSPILDTAVQIVNFLASILLSTMGTTLLCHRYLHDRVDYGSCPVIDLELLLLGALPMLVARSLVFVKTIGIF